MKSQRPRILFVTPLPPPIHGAALVSKQIRNMLVLNEGFNPVFINSSTSRSLDEIGKSNLIKIFRYIKIFFILFGKLLTNKYDLCYLAITCHGKGFLKDAPFVLMCKLFGNKIIIHQHNQGMSADVGNPIMKWLFELVYRKTKVILLSELLFPDIEKIVDKNDVFICPNGIKQTVFPNSDKKFIHGNTVRLLFLSNMLLAKGVMILLDSLREIKGRGFDFQCDFYGNESREITRESFNAVTHDYGLDSNVSFKGPIYGKLKDSAFDNSDLFILPSFNEAFPLVLLEAMQHSLPIISTHVGGIPDIVIDGVNGLLIDAGDSKALADAIQHLLNDAPLRVKMGKAGFERFSNNYSETIFEQRITQILKSCITI